MTTTETLSIHQPEDVLGYIPHLLGYWPEDSLVAITLQGNLFGATLRVDLPTTDSPVGRAAFAEYVRTHLLADGQANGVVFALYNDEGWEDGSVVLRAMPLLSALKAALGPVGLPIREAWLVGSRYWRSAFCDNPECCPVPGLPVEQIRNSRINAEMVYRGSTVGSPPGSTEDPPVLALNGACDAQILEAESRFAEQLREAWRSELCFDAVLGAWQRVLNHAGPDSQRPTDRVPGPFEGPAGKDRAGFLRAALTVPAWRDAVMVMAAGGFATAKAGARAFNLFSDDVSRALPFDLFELGLGPVEPEKVAPCPGDGPTAGGNESTVAVFSYGEVLLGLQPAVPDWQMLEALRRTLVSLCFDGEQSEAAASALTVQGWISWCKGNGSLADVCLGRALAARPGYRLAELLEGILGQGTISSWARRQESAWGTYAAAHE
ncbi:DUF4192 domain-containing protein [Paenarthrobacter sp. S56]|uniref:DUF4192 domain-containing protein n=1 Tax=Paenarthrobacter sp. S56 TaxID=3138179 RepID=UPI003219F173